MKVSSNPAPAHVVAPDVSRRLPRPRLLRRLAQAFASCSAQWLAAPPGSGKTTLAAAHAGALECTV
jgi:ATP/maltotriose-dependent transcriptional regulator MalT